jgi:hypothetical protein
MKRKLIPVAALGLLLLSSAGVSAQFWLPTAPWGVYGWKSNDTGGIIPWSPHNEEHAYEIAQGACSTFDKYALATSIHRVPGDYIGYKCVWDPPGQKRPFPSR